MEEMRLYVKNLPPDLKNDDVQKYFHKFGDVSNIALKGNYGFFSVKGSREHLEKMLNKYDQKNWNDYIITLQKSEKENFMEKLARERLMEKEEVYNPVNIEVKSKVKKRKFDDLDTSEDDGNVKAGIPMFSGTKAINGSKHSTFPNNNKKYNTETDVMTSFNEYDSMWADTAETSSFTTFLKSGESQRDNSKIKAAKSPMTKIEKKLRDDERRKQSLANKAKEINKQKTVIQSALSNLANPKQNKIVFSDNDYDDNVANASGKMNLFDDIEGEDEKIVLPSNKHFDGEAGQKLLQMQTQFNNDDRFKLDQRFLDSDAGIVKIEEKRQVEMVRYDPTRSLTSNQVDENRAKIIKANTSKSVPVVSKEKFYEVSEGIKTSLQQKGSGFSLLATYGNQNKDDESSKLLKNDEQVTKILKRNPTVLDSSDEEDDMDSPIKKWEPTVNIPFGSRDNFFFSENDPLLSEGFEFMNKKNSEESTRAAENYDVTRRILKKIFKDQILKRCKKTDMFKKKVGGMKKKGGNFKSKQNGHIKKR